MKFFCGAMNTTMHVLVLDVYFEVSGYLSIRSPTRSAHTFAHKMKGTKLSLCQAYFISIIVVHIPLPLRVLHKQLQHVSNTSNISVEPQK